MRLMQTCWHFARSCFFPCHRFSYNFFCFFPVLCHFFLWFCIFLLVNIRAHDWQWQWFGRLVAARCSPSQNSYHPTIHMKIPELRAFRWWWLWFWQVDFFVCQTVLQANVEHATSRATHAGIGIILNASRDQIRITVQEKVSMRCEATHQITHMIKLSCVFQLLSFEMTTQTVSGTDSHDGETNEIKLIRSEIAETEMWTCFSALSIWLRRKQLPYCRSSSIPGASVCVCALLLRLRSSSHPIPHTVLSIYQEMKRIVWMWIGRAAHWWKIGSKNVYYY